jgi:carbonic anhydrase
MSLHCDALIVNCIDFRLVPSIRRFTDTELAGKTFDEVGYAGATKDWDAIMEEIDISERLHGPKQLVLINHEDCGAYGAEGTPERHAADLRRAREAVLAKYPDVRVDLYYLHLDGTFQPVG